MHQRTTTDSTWPSYLLKRRVMMNNQHTDLYTQLLREEFFSEWPNVWSCCLILSKSSNSTEQVIFYHTEFIVLCSVILIEIDYMCVMGDKLKSTQKVFFCFHHLFKLCLTLIVKTVPTFIMGEIFFCIIISYII